MSKEKRDSPTIAGPAPLKAALRGDQRLSQRRTVARLRANYHPRRLYRLFRAGGFIALNDLQYKITGLKSCHNRLQCPIT